MVWDEGNKQGLKLLRTNDGERIRAPGKKNY